MATISMKNRLEDFSFEIDELEGRNSITVDYYGSCKKVTIPASVGGIPVTAIGDYAFGGCINLKEIKFPKSLVAIGSNAFADCKMLTKITIPKGLINIGNDAFSGCKNLKGFEVDEGNPVYASHEGVLLDKKMSTLIKYPEGKEGEYTIPDSVVFIENFAFDGCGEISSLIFPQGLVSINYNMFYSCEQLNNFLVNQGNSFFSSIDGVLFNKEGTELIQYPHGKENADYIVPEGVHHIEAKAFHECKWLTKITFPENLKTIEDSAFYGCERLTEITLPINVQYIGWDAFGNCPNLKTITLSINTKTGYKTFRGFSGKIVYLD